MIKKSSSLTPLPLLLCFWWLRSHGLEMDFHFFLWFLASFMILEVFVKMVPNSICERRGFGTNRGGQECGVFISGHIDPNILLVDLHRFLVLQSRHSLSHFILIEEDRCTTSGGAFGGVWRWKERKVRGHFAIFKKRVC